MLEAIKNLLVAAGLGTFGTNLFIGYMPDSPATATALFDSGGEDPDDYLLEIQKATFHILVRSTDYSAGRQKLDDIYALLHGKANFEENGVYFYNILAISRGGHIGRDDQNRDQWSINFKCKIR